MSRCSACSRPATCRSLGRPRGDAPRRAGRGPCCHRSPHPPPSRRWRTMTTKAIALLNARRGRHGLLPPGRGRHHRQAGPRRRRVRPDRRDGRPRRGRPGGARLRRKRTATRSVFVTADHAHTSQIVGGSAPGLTAADHPRRPMIANYATAAAGIAAAHRHAAAHRRLRAARGQRRRSDRPDRASRPGPRPRRG